MPTGTTPATRSATRPAASGPAIQYFTLVADEETGSGRRLTFRWQATGASAMLYSGTAERMGPWWPVPLAGELTVELSGTNFRDPEFTLSVSATEQGTPSPEPPATASIQIAWACDPSYFFAPAPPRCPLGPAVASAAAEQPFEGGSLLWLAEEGTIIVLYANGRWERYPDTWDESQPAEDPALTSPAGRYQPRRGFGKVWRERPGVRDQLGWALAPEQGFNSLIQYEEHEGSSSGAPTYVRRLDGSTVSLFPFWASAGSWHQEAP